MAIEQAVIQNYAQALLAVVQKEQISLDDSLEEAKSIRAILRDHSNLQHFLQGPQFNDNEKTNLVKNVFSDRLSKVFYHFLLLLLKHDRIDHLPYILEHYEVLIEKEQGITIGHVYTAIALSEEEKSRFKEKLEAYLQRRFDLRFHTDPRLIGGVKVRFGDTLIDTSIASYLSDMNKRLKETRIAS